jgi:hypothetical protein
MVASRKYSPYTLKVVRRVKEYLSAIDNNQVKAAGDAPLVSEKFFFNYKIEPQNT